LFCITASVPPEAAFRQVVSRALFHERKHVVGVEEHEVVGGPADRGEIVALDELADGGGGAEAQEGGDLAGVEERREGARGGGAAHAVEGGI
jgi:hypothetical protein